MSPTPNYDRQNIFAKILRGEIPSQKVYEDEACIAILDLFPVNPGHVLVIPKAEATIVADLDEALAAHVMAVGARISKAIRASVPQCEAVNFWISDGAAAGQEVPHVHLHVIPRFAGDGFGWKVGPLNRQKQSDEALASVSASLKAALGAGKA